ncbi:hypothetical protein [Plantactinospora alkalitolerans]|nr:hypothetical protein [Plantactinospora alkalitolerans]
MVDRERTFVGDGAVIGWPADHGRIAGTAVAWLSQRPGHRSKK